MLQPANPKHRKHFKGRNRGVATRGNKVSFGEFGLTCTELGGITSRQIESARVAINRALKRGGKLWIRIFPDVPRTKKPLEVRQGKGKGSVDRYEALVKPGTVVFEVEGVSEELAREAFRRAAHKLPVKTRFIEREAM